jgi:hypothetical protein
MSLLDKLNTIISEQNIPVETGIFSGVPPDLYAVLTPLTDDFSLFADDKPQLETQEVRISVFSKNDYRPTVKALVNAFLAANITITERRYVGFEAGVKYHNYAIDVSQIFTLGEV